MTRTADDVLHDFADEYAHQAFHGIARGANTRSQLGALFLDGFLIGAQLGMVDREAARALVDQIARTPDCVHELFERVESIRSAAR